MTMPAGIQWAYVGRKACGCAVRVVADDPQDRLTVAREAARMIRHGLTLERIALTKVGEAVRPCPHVRRPRIPKRRQDEQDDAERLAVAADGIMDAIHRIQARGGT